MPRRCLLVLLAALTLGLLPACGGEAEPLVFTHGVASGDVTPDGAVLWTRANREATLTVEVATDEAFGNVVATQEARAERERDFTVKVEVAGLQPSAQYYYRFRGEEAVSEPGRFRTAPSETAAARVRFVFSGDSDGTVREDGTRAFDFKALDAARQEDADFFLYFGDTIYADSSFGPKAQTLSAFRAKYKENREVERLRQILASTSIYTIWDDHEVENNFAGTTVDPDLLEAGRQAFREYMPIGGDDTPEVLYRRFRWGKHVELIILDERTFRSDDAEAACTPPGAQQPDLLPILGGPRAPQRYRDLRDFANLPPRTDRACLDALRDPSRTMLGQEQKAFLLRALQESDATFKFVVNEVPITELAAQPYDRWEGYRAERDEILRFIAQQKIKNVVFLTTDFHANVLSDVRITLAGQPVAVEAITGPIAHETLGDAIAGDAGPALADAFEGLLFAVPRASCVELDAFSYGLVDVGPRGRGTAITLKDENGKTLCRRVLQAK